MNDRPRQHFPGENEPNNDQTQQFSRYPEDSYADRDFAGGRQQFQQPQYEQPQYQQYEHYEEPAEEKRGPGALAMIMSVLFLVALVAAGILYFLWQDAAARADRQPATVTETSVSTSLAPPTTVTVTEEGLPFSVPSEIPSGLPSEIPSELPSGGIDVEGFLNDLLSQGGADEPAPAP
ncbi:hypothetical protein [Corynebacterium guangdongense]|uniref:Uncharacterized protein n=1 Tax=Corynebacterium guangdongense TaxID=1783348 RepID=A0ABU1ZU61_9CORY|nr:hypothetical protein [Corynebacterium guangdongense]MDR7328466.1 hypothetical protein [Corynebacterium guangdongense]WJZ17043.1 hypothetical protein CGUA_02215 [Corynebacterium guangdongense]